MLSLKYVTGAGLYAIFLFYGGFTVEKVRLLLPSSGSTFDKTCIGFAYRILLCAMYFPDFWSAIKIQNSLMFSLFISSVSPLFSSSPPKSCTSE